MADLAGDETSSEGEPRSAEHPAAGPAAGALEAEADQPAPMLIKRVRAPEQRVGKVTGHMSEADANALAVAIPCGVNFGSRNEAMAVTRERVTIAARTPVRGSWPHERPLAPTVTQRGEVLPHRSEVYVVVGEALVMACPAGPHGVCLIAHTPCERC